MKPKQASPAQEPVEYIRNEEYVATTGFSSWFIAERLPLMGHVEFYHELPRGAHGPRELIRCMHCDEPATRVHHNQLVCPRHTPDS